jgi:glycosyltransferase involved in cell wall biosynthesis
MIFYIFDFNNVTHGGIERRLVNYFRNTQKYLDLNLPPVPTNIHPAPMPITVVTTCMNRLDDVSKTLPKNLADNEDYPNAEFLLLDYNSTDGLEEWVKSEMMGYINTGRLVYYRTTDRSRFCPNHSRNVSFKLATGPLVVNVDTDNYMHPGFLRRLNQCASVKNKELLIVPENFLLPKGDKLLLKGRFAMYKKDIEFLRGFDEELDYGYGFDDINFIFRAMVAGFNITRFEAAYNEDRIETPMAKRYELINTEGLDAGHRKNVRLTMMKLMRGVISANAKGWGEAKVVKNFSEEITC